MGKELSLLYKCSIIIFIFHIESLKGRVSKNALKVAKELIVKSNNIQDLPWLDVNKLKPNFRTAYKWISLGWKCCRGEFSGTKTHRLQWRDNREPFHPYSHKGKRERTVRIIIGQISNELICLPRNRTESGSSLENG